MSKWPSQPMQVGNYFYYFFFGGKKKDFFVLGKNKTAGINCKIPNYEKSIFLKIK